MGENQDDINKGREAMMYFHNASVGRGGYSPATLEACIAAVGLNPTVFLDGFGFAINTVRLSSGDVKSAMSALAAKANGKVPTANSFFAFIKNQSAQISYVALTVDVAKHVAVTTGEGLQNIGSTVLNTSKLLLLAAPLIVAYIVWMNVKKVT